MYNYQQRYGILNLKVDDIDIQPDEGGNYEATLTDEIDIANIKVELVSSTSKVSIDGKAENIERTEADVNKSGNRALYIPVKVTAEDGTEHIYTLTINIIETDTAVQKVVVNNEECIIVDGRYQAMIGTYDITAEAEITANSQYAKVSYENAKGEKEENLHILNLQIDTSDLTKTVIVKRFKVTAEDGREKEYEIILVRRTDDLNIKNVYEIKDEGEEIEILPNIGKEGYEDGTYYMSTSKDEVDIKVLLNSEFSKVAFNGEEAYKELIQKITLDTASRITEVIIKVTSEEGNTYETTLYIEKMSGDFEIEYVKANNKEAEKQGILYNYISYIEDIVDNVHIEIKARSNVSYVVLTDEYGNPKVDIDGNELRAIEFINQDIAITQDTTMVYFKIIAESGEASPVCKLQIEKISTDTGLKEVYVEGKSIKPNSKGEYWAQIVDTLEETTVKAITNSELASIRIGFNKEVIHISEEILTVTDGKEMTIPLIVKSQSGNIEVTYLHITKVSSSVRLQTVTVDGKTADYYNAESKTYTFIVDNSKEDFELYVEGENELVTLTYEGTDRGKAFTEIVRVEIAAEGRTFYVTAKAESGNTEEYRIDIVHKSTNTDLEYVKVNNIEREKDKPDGNTYTVVIPINSTSAQLEIQTLYDYANIQIANEEARKHTASYTVDCSNFRIDKFEIPVVVTTADGEISSTYTIILVRGAYITGKILTENANGEHISKVTVYRQDKIEDELTGEISIEEIEAGSVETASDGTFKIIAEHSAEHQNSTYKVLVTKIGYLNYTVTDISLEEIAEINIGEYNLIAGDIIKTGEINLDDLVKLNESFTISVNGEADKNKACDLNEDGRIDRLDRQILKKNYGKHAEIVSRDGAN